MLDKEDIQAIAKEVYNLQKADGKKDQGASVGANNRARAKSGREQKQTKPRKPNGEKASKIGLLLFFLVGDIILLVYLLPYFFN